MFTSCWVRARLQVSPMHDQHASKSIWSAPKAVESRMVCAPGRSKAVPPVRTRPLAMMGDFQRRSDIISWGPCVVLKRNTASQRRAC
jgi:hypothetical protein